MPNPGDSIYVENASGNTQAVVTVGGYTFIVPIAVAQSFFALQSYVAVNVINAPTIPSGDQAGWTALAAGAGITMGA